MAVLPDRGIWTTGQSIRAVGALLLQESQLSVQMAEKPLTQGLMKVIKIFQAQIMELILHGSGIIFKHLQT
jgi:hypothetical protein